MWLILSEHKQFVALGKITKIIIKVRTEIKKNNKFMRRDIRNNISTYVTEAVKRDISFEKIDLHIFFRFSFFSLLTLDS